MVFQHLFQGAACPGIDQEAAVVVGDVRDRFSLKSLTGSQMHLLCLVTRLQSACNMSLAVLVFRTRRPLSSGVVFNVGPVL